MHVCAEDTAEAALDINATGECASELKQLCKPELAAYLKASAEAGNARQLLAVKPLPELTVDQLMTVIRDAYKGVNSSLSAAEKAQAVMSSKPLAHLRNMPMARCLRQSMNAAKQSIDPNTAEVATRCKQDSNSHTLTHTHTHTPMETHRRNPTQVKATDPKGPSTAARETR